MRAKVETPASASLGSLRVLLADPDAEFRLRTVEVLIGRGLEVESASTVQGAIDWAREEAFDIIVCDPRISPSGELDFVSWALGYSPTTPIMVTTEDLDPKLRGQLADHPVVHFLDKPFDGAALADALEAIGPKRGFYGKAIEVELFDYVQMIALSGSDRLLVVSTPRGDGRIWFEHGDIVHTQYRDFTGERAFYKLLAVGRGTFSEAFGGEPPQRTVTRSSTHLLMEAARRSDEGTLGVDPDGHEVVGDEESSFGDLNEASGSAMRQESSVVEEIPEILEADPEPVPDAATQTGPHPPVVAGEPSGRFPLAPRASDNEDEDFAALVNDAIEDQTLPETFDSASSMAHGVLRDEDVLDPAESQAAMSLGGNAIFEDPATRSGMLEQFWAFEGINGVAIISSTGKVLAEDMRSNSSLVTLAGFYMRGAARIARTLGYNVFDGVVARSVNGQQMVMVSMGAASAVLSVEADADPEAVRDAVMGVE